MTSTSYSPADVLRWAARMVREELGAGWVDGDRGVTTGKAWLVRPSGSITPVQPQGFEGQGQYYYERMVVQVDLQAPATLGDGANLDDWASIYEAVYALQARLCTSESYKDKDGSRVSASGQEYGGIQVVQCASKAHFETAATPEQGMGTFGMRMSFSVQFTRWEERR